MTSNSNRLRSLTLIDNEISLIIQVLQQFQQIFIQITDVGIDDNYVIRIYYLLLFTFEVMAIDVLEG